MPQINWPTSISLGRLIALVLLILVLVLVIIGRISGLEAWFFGGLSLAVLLV